MTANLPEKVRPSAGRGRALTVEEVLPYVGPCRGNVSAIARALGVSRPCIYRRIKASAKLQAALESAREERIDTAESALDAAVERGEPWAVSLLLRTLGRDRGYGEGAQVTMTGGVEIAFSFASPDGPADDEEIQLADAS